VVVRAVRDVVVHEDDDVLVLEPALLHDLVRVAHVRLSMDAAGSARVEMANTRNTYESPHAELTTHTGVIARKHMHNHPVRRISHAYQP